MSIYFEDENNGWATIGMPGSCASSATGGSYKILKTIDGGVLWIQHGKEYFYWLQVIHFSENGKGWAVGDATGIITEFPQSVQQFNYLSISLAETAASDSENLRHIRTRG